MPRFDNVHDFRKAAHHRLRDAQELLERPTLDAQAPDRDRRHLRGAMYLAGYSVECILKAYLVDMHRPLQTLSAVDAKLRASQPRMANLLSSEGHSIAVILGFTDLEAYQTELIRRQFGQLSSLWSVDMRYDPSYPVRPQAAEHVRNAKEIFDWVNSRF